MKISYNWLKDYIDLNIPPEELGKVLTMAGLPMESIQKFSDDHVLELEVTANRPDWLSMVGVAREIAAITGKKFKVPLSSVPRSSSEKGKGIISIKVEDKKLCPRYTARTIRDVRVGESPAKLKARLEAMELRPVNNIVDITNFCLFETGEPMHAFDLDKIEGQSIVVRRARKGEKIVTIDGVERTLDDSVLVIADSARSIAIAGVMGGLNTEVTASTKNILLEAAYFDPISIRRTSRKLGISTESSYRFERKVDLANIVYASDRASGIISETAGGSIEGFNDIGDRPASKESVSLKYSHLDKIAGVKIAPSKVKKILASLGLRARASSKDGATFEIPSFRYDLNYEIDLIEEVLRIYGYDMIPNTIPEVVEQPARMPHDMIIEKKIRTSLTGLGLDEVITYSLLSRRLLQTAGIPEEGIVEIQNPLSSEQEAMRPTLVVGMLNSILWNINRKTKDLKLFELGKVYRKGLGDDFREKEYLSIAIAGQAYSTWLTGSRPASFFDLKGIVEELFLELGIEKISFRHAKAHIFSQTACASVEIDGENVGTLGELNSRALGAFDIKEPVYFCEVCVDSILKHVPEKKKFIEMPKYPSVFRDISIIVGKEVPHFDLMSSIRSAAGAILKDIKLIDRYAGRQIPEGKVGLTYRLEYQDLKKTLEDKDVLDVHAKVLRELGEKLGAKLR